MQPLGWGSRMAFSAKACGPWGSSLARGVTNTGASLSSRSPGLPCEMSGSFLPSVHCRLFLRQSPPKSSDGSTESNKENAATESGSESSSQEATPEKGEKQDVTVGMGVNPCSNDGVFQYPVNL